MLPTVAEWSNFSVANDEFVLDGRVHRIHASCFHYFRVRPVDWKDRLLRVKALGCNAIEAYIPWK